MDVKKNILRFDEIDIKLKKLKDKIKPYQELIKELNTEKKELKESLCRHVILTSKEPVVCNLQDSALKFSKSEILLGMSKDRIKTQIYKFFKSEESLDFNELRPSDKTRVLYNFIYDKNNRDRTLRFNLNRVKKVRGSISSGSSEED